MVQKRPKAILPTLRATPINNRGTGFMPSQIKNLNKLERILRSFGIDIRPRQTARGEILLPLIYQGNGFSCMLTCVGGEKTALWRGSCSQRIKNRIEEHFQAFLAVDSL